jgi:hypothetical protein
VAGHQTRSLLGDAQRAVAQRLIAEIDKFNLDRTGIAEFHEFLSVETDDSGELVGGVYCWAREDLLDRSALGA